MENKYRFTKDHTLAVKGIAIVLLLCYHCFSREFRFNGMEVNFWPLTKEKAMFWSESAVNCVGMFVFLSVYGMTLSMKKRFQNYEFSREEATLYVIRRYLTVLSMFLIPFIFCEAVTAIKGLSRYGEGKVEQIGNFLMDMIGFGDIFGTQMIVGTWWYISFLVMITIFMPMLIRAYRHYGWLLVPMFLIPGLLFLEENVNMTKWLFAVPFAICFADQQVLERMRAFHIVKEQWLNKILKFLITTLLLWILIRLRASDWGKEYLRFAMNGVVPVVMIYWSYEFIIELPVIRQVLTFLGRHSADIFFVHSFIRGVWYRKASYSFYYAGVILLVLLVASLGISIFFDLVRKITKYDQATKQLTAKMLDWCKKRLTVKA